MGCSSSSPQAVVNELTAIQQTQDAAGDVNPPGTPLKAEDSIRVPANTPNEGHHIESDENQDERKDSGEAHDFQGAETMVTKKGGLVFEINLGANKETGLDMTKRLLPRRLKRLEPLPGAPKLTAEELNEKLERAEQKHLKALAMRKSRTRRHIGKHAPLKTGDAPLKSQKSKEDSGKPSSSGATENDAVPEIPDQCDSKAALEGANEVSDEPHDSEKAGADSEEQQLPNFEVVDLKNSNCRNMPALLMTTAHRNRYFLRPLTEENEEIEELEFSD